MDERLDELQRLHADCSWAIDHHEAAEYADLFSADGELRIEPRGITVSGRDALRKFAEASPAGVHVSGPISPRPDGSTGTAFIFISAETGRAISGYYADRYVRDTSGRLVFASRAVTMMAPRTR